MSNKVNDENEMVQPAPAIISNYVKTERPIELKERGLEVQKRLLDGHGECVVYLGMEDFTEQEEKLDLNGFVSRLEELDEISKQLGCVSSVIYVNAIDDSPEGSTRRKEYKGAVLVREIPPSVQELQLEIRVAVAGNVDAGKSTTLGVLTKGVKDDGRGKARLNLFKHQHEIESGRTSSIGMEIMGFDSMGNVVGNSSDNSEKRSIKDIITRLMDPSAVANTQVESNGSLEAATHKKLSWEVISQNSTKVLTFIDLAGHEKYLKTTVSGMTGYAPDYVMLMVGANAGMIGMTKEHMSLAVALNVPFFIVITKVDMCPSNVLDETIRQISKILKSPGCRKTPVFVKSMEDVCVSVNHFLADSNVTGAGLPLLKNFLNLLSSYQPLDFDAPFSMDLTDVYSVPGVGTVVAGCVNSGTVEVGTSLFIGPDSSGGFLPCVIKSIQRKRTGVTKCLAGQNVSMALKKVKKAQFRKGMVLVDKNGLPQRAPSPFYNDVTVKLPSVLFGYLAREFEAEVLVLYHSTTIRPNYQAMIHCGTVRQTASIVSINSINTETVLRTGDRSFVRFRFVKHPEYIQLGRRMIFREGRTKGIGKISRVFASF